MKNLLSVLAVIFFIIPGIVIALCLFIMIFSLAVDAVTGFNLIEQVIRPFFGN